MSSIENTSRAPFFPRSREGQETRANTQKIGPKNTSVSRNNAERIKQLQTLSKRGDAKVDIPSTTRDFSRIKAAVDKAPDLDKSDKVAALKKQINDGSYQVDYEAVADKMLNQQF